MPEPITYLDGNNLMGGFDPVAGAGDRERFLQALLAFRLPKPCCVVFDGPPPRGGSGGEARRGVLRILYAGARKADSVIVERVRTGDRVVTADLELASACRGQGARVVRPAEFLAGLRPRSVPPGEKPSGASRSEVDEWLAVFGQ